MTLDVCQGHSSIASLFYTDKHVSRFLCHCRPSYFYSESVIGVSFGEEEGTSSLCPRKIFDVNIIDYSVDFAGFMTSDKSLLLADG